MKTLSREKDLTTVKFISYVLKGEPIPLARPRLGHNHAFDSQKRVKAMIGLQLNSYHRGRPPLTGPLQLDVTYFMKTPKAKPKLNNQHHAVRPDLDNLIKMTLDTCQDCNCFLDDAQICVIHAQKIYSQEPRTELTLTQIGATNG